MNAVTFSIVIATIGRPTLAVTLIAVAGQIEPGDQLLVECDDTGDWGNTPRNRALARCTGTHILFIDDDDHHTPDALTTIRRHVAEQPERVHVFAMRRADRTFIPVMPLEFGAVGTPMICAPNIPDRLGSWSTRYEGDYDFLHSTLALHDQPPVLHPDVVAIVS